MEALKLENKDLLWVGGIGGMEAGLVERKQVPFRAIPAAGVHGVGLKKLPGNLWKLAKGYFASRQILKAFKPDVLLFTGGYVAIPMALAARHKPMALYVPDIEPGLALKVLAYFARRIALTTESSKMYYKNQEKISVTVILSDKTSKNGPSQKAGLILASNLACLCSYLWAAAVAPGQSTRHCWQSYPN